MGKKIVVLNGSPRAKGNTAAMIDAFTEGAAGAGHKVKRFDLQKMDVRPCLGCLKGGKDGVESPCVQKDGMEEVYAAYREADVLVFASPLYFWSISAQLKAALDRLFAVTEATGGVPTLSCALLVAAEEDSAQNFAPLNAYYDTLLQNIGWKDAGRVLVGGVMEVGDIADKPGLADAKKLGAAL